MSDIPASPTTVFAATIIGDDIVCRQCLNMEETVTAQRGITDPVTNEDVEKKEIICARCGKKVEPFKPF
uniref:Uncharacterized protein n=1 Tax=Candidatus Desulfatibia profunda TaxID=2841695 RepID=A0A8J6NQ21_9BACT|nr:hypothetical protein [Candidatus Desulfatibia profunda]